MPVDVEIDPSAVTVRFRGSDRFWAFSRGIVLPWERIVRATAVDRTEAEKSASWLRMGGSYIPRRLHAGRYGLGDRRQLWCVRRAGRVLAIDVVGRPSRLVIEVSDPDGTAREIEERRPR